MLGTFVAKTTQRCLLYSSIWFLLSSAKPTCGDSCKATVRHKLWIKIAFTTWAQRAFGLVRLIGNIQAFTCQHFIMDRRPNAFFIRTALHGWRLGDGLCSRSCSFPGAHGQNRGILQYCPAKFGNISRINYSGEAGRGQNACCRNDVHELCDRKWHFWAFSKNTGCTTFVKFDDLSWIVRPKTAFLGKREKTQIG